MKKEDDAKGDVQKGDTKKGEAKKGEIKDVADVQGSLKIHIKLDLEVDIHIVAKLKGDIAIGIL